MEPFFVTIRGRTSFSGKFSKPYIISNLEKKVFKRYSPFALSHSTTTVT